MRSAGTSLVQIAMRIVVSRNPRLTLEDGGVEPVGRQPPFAVSSSQANGIASFLK